MVGLSALRVTPFARSLRLASISRRKALSGISVILLSLPLAAQSGTDTPIKVRGGAMTFFSHEKWQNTGTKAKRSYCSSVDASEVSVVRVERFFDDGEKKHFNQLDLTSPTWRIEFRGHKEVETTATATREEGIVMQASPLDCGGKSTGKASVTLTLLGKGGFYPNALLAGGDFKDNRRFKSTCKIDNDRCERIAEIKVFDTDPAKAAYRFHCPDGDCTVLVGKD